MIHTLEDMSSPNDWPEWLPEMRNIDNLLRCSICKEYFVVAMLIQECSHNYCSLCIRQSITNKTHCPTCSVNISGKDLKCNRVLDELVSNFVKVRSKLLELIKTGRRSDKKNNEASDDSDDNFMKTPTCRGKNSLQKKRLGKGKSPRATPRNKRKRQRIVESESDDPEYEPVNVSIKQESAQTRKVDPSPDKPTVSTSENQLAAGTLSYVECPVCEEMIDNKTINSHLDTCLIRGEKKSSLRSSETTSVTKNEKSLEVSTVETAASSFVSPPTSSSSSSPPKQKSFTSISSVTGSNAFISNKPKRKLIPGLVYALLSDKQLKQKLKEWNLSTQGGRQTMVKRHQEFVTIYNAQCDSTNPKAASLIVKEIEIRENQKRSKKFAGTSTNTAMPPLKKDSSSEEVEKARKICSSSTIAPSSTVQQHGDQFQQLINDLKMRRKKTAASTKEKTPTVCSVTIDDQEAVSTKEKTPTVCSVTIDDQEAVSTKEKTPTVCSVTIDDQEAVSTKEKTPTICSVTIDDQESNQEMADAETVKNHDKNMPSSCDDNTNVLIADSTSMDTAPSDDPTDMRTKAPGCSTSHNDVQSSERSQDVVMEDSEAEVRISQEEKCSNSQRTDDGLLESRRNQQLQVPEPPSPSSLVQLNDTQDNSGDDDDGYDDDGDDDSGDDDGGDDGKGDHDLDSSPSLGLAGSGEEEFKEYSESDEELFKPEIQRSPVKVRSLRPRKR